MKHGSVTIRLSPIDSLQSGWKATKANQSGQKTNFRLERLWPQSLESIMLR